MQPLKRLFREKYQLTNYQIALLGYFYKTVLSEVSKLLIIGLLFGQHLEELLITLSVMIVLRCFTGGLHFDTYWGCLFGSILLVGLSVLVLPSLMMAFPFKVLVLLLCIVVINRIGPVISRYRPAYDEGFLNRCKWFVLIFISFYALLIYIMPNSYLLNVGAGVIILHTLQLVAAKYKRKESL